MKVINFELNFNIFIIFINYLLYILELFFNFIYITINKYFCKINFKIIFNFVFIITIITIYLINSI